jgi:GNAT superfamily N-acetyltransferase
MMAISCRDVIAAHAGVSWVDRTEEAMTFSVRRFILEEMDRAAIIHRTSFKDRLPWLAGLHTPEEDRTYFRERIFASCQVWGAATEEIVGIIAFREEWIDQLYVLPQHQGQGIGGRSS